MIYPRPLQPGDTLGLIGISGAVRRTDPAIDPVAGVCEKAQGLGFKVKVHESVGAVYGYLSGSDELRAKAVHDMFADPEVDGVYCVRGGYGVSRILDRLNYGLISANPKPLIGYSDITALHTAIHMHCGFVTYHGPMLSSDSLSPVSDGFSRESLLRVIQAKAPLGAIENPPGFPYATVTPGIAKGQLVGGNLSLIAALMGTPYELDVKGKILFLEDIGEKTYALDRMFTTLRLAGKFDDCAGILLGAFTDCPIEDEAYGLPLEEIISDVLVPSGKPILAGLQAGHCAPKVTLPLGAEFVMDAGAGVLRWV